MQTKYENIPEDIIQVFLDRQSLLDVIEELAPIPFTYKKIKKLALEAGKLKEKGYMMLYYLYPEIKDKAWSVDHEERVLTIKS